jgi:hypothetical protein
MHPNVHRVGIPPDMQRQCFVRVRGGPYAAEMDVNWEKGKALTAFFEDDKVVLEQRKEPLYFASVSCRGRDCVHSWSRPPVGFEFVNLPLLKFFLHGDGEAPRFTRVQHLGTR